MPNAPERNSPLRGAKQSDLVNRLPPSGNGETARVGSLPPSGRRARYCRSPTACRPSERATASALASFFEWALAWAPARGRFSVSVPEPVPALLKAPEPGLASVLWTALEPALGQG